jgi:hypothetical protein
MPTYFEHFEEAQEQNKIQKDDFGKLWDAFQALISIQRTVIATGTLSTQLTAEQIGVMDEAFETIAQYKSPLANALIEEASLYFSPLHSFEGDKMKWLEKAGIVK